MMASILTDSLESEDRVPSVEPSRLSEFARRTIVATVRQYSALASASRAAEAAAAPAGARTCPRARGAQRVPSPRSSAAAPTPSSDPAATSSACPHTYFRNSWPKLNMLTYGIKANF